MRGEESALIALFLFLCVQRCSLTFDRIAVNFAVNSGSPLRLLDSLSRLFYAIRVIVTSEAKQVRKFAERYNPILLAQKIARF